MKQAKITFLTSVGAGLEHYDLVIYSLLANFISQQFFPGYDRATALFATFGVFVLGSIVRPLGGVIFGIFGDRFGRKNVFANTMLWMALVTFFMGLIPTFATLGLVATALFSICKILQGVIFGAEMPGALTFLLEHIDKKRQGLHFGFMISSLGVGVSLGSFVIWILTRFLSDGAMVAWGFRIPFILGGGLALIGFYIRKHLPETPMFLATQKSNTKLTLKVVKNHVWQVLNIVGILLFPASYITFFLVLPVYLHDIYHFAFSDIYLAITCGYVWSAVSLPFFGWLSDYIGKKLLLIIASLVMIVFSFPIFSLLQTNTRWAVFVFVFFGQTIISAMSASYFVLIPQAFQTVVRYTGTAFSYNISYTITAIMPLVANYIYEVVKRPVYIVWIFMLLSMVTIISTLTLKIKYDDSGNS